MTINLKPEQERIIQAEIDSGHFRSSDEVLDHALAALREKEHKRTAYAVLYHGLTIVSRNVIDFGVVGLAVVHPWEART